MHENGLLCWHYAQCFILPLAGIMGTGLEELSQFSNFFSFQQFLFSQLAFSTICSQSIAIFPIIYHFSSVSPAFEYT